MKNLTENSISLLIGLFLSSSAFAANCPDFSGTFEQTTNSTSVTLTVTQQKCDSVSFSFYYPSDGETIGKIYPLDSQRRKTYEDASTIVYETSGIVDGELQNLVEDFYKATGVTMKAIAHFQLTPAKDIVNENDFYNASGQIDQSTTNDYTRTR